MWKGFELTVEEEPATMSKVFTTKIHEMARTEAEIQILVVEKTSQGLADELIKELLPTIMEKISPEAIANLALAKSAAKVKREIDDES